MNNIDSPSPVDRFVGSTEEAAGNLMVECSPSTMGHDIPVAVSPPHDQRAHGLPQDLKGRSGKC
jgi:hypothetical protein